MRKEFRDLISVEEAEAIIDGFRLDPGTETLPLREANGRVLAEDVESPMDVPPFPKSLMDGYAVRAEDTYGAEELRPERLSYAGSVEAGEEPPVALGEDEAVEIATGAVLPEGADAVVMVERTDREGDEVLVRRAVAPDENVLGAGADIPAGSVVVEASTTLGPRELGGLAAVGTGKVSVRRRPRVAVVSTGYELVEPGKEDLGRGRIYESNSRILAAALEDAGCVPRYLGIAGDERERIEEVLRDAEEFDAVISSGSTSAGAGDLLYRVVEERGELLAHGVKLKPGKPTVLARLGETPFVGLPGNPSSTYSVYRRLVDPFLRRHTGRPESGETVRAAMGSPAKSETGRHHLRFVSLERRDGEMLAHAVEKVSGAITLLLDADGYVEVPEGVSRLDEGEEVEVTLLSPLP